MSYQGVTGILDEGLMGVCWDCSISALAAIFLFPSSPMG